VHTGVVLLPGQAGASQGGVAQAQGEGNVVRAALPAQARVVTTRVRFGPMTPEEIEWYIATGEPEGKAGGYAIQGRASRFIEWIDGSWSNVVGLPVADVYRMLRQAGVIS
jgi:septum formation protein